MTNDINIKEKKIWKAERKKLIEAEVIDENDFEEARRCLLNSYHSYVQNHVGYLLTAIIGLIATIYSSGTLLKSGLGGVIAFSILIIGIPLVLIFMSLRIVYWSIYANIALIISIDTAIQNFNDYNFCLTSSPYEEKAPNTAIIQYAIGREIDKVKENQWLPPYARFAVWIAKINVDWLIYRMLKRLKSKIMSTSKEES